MVSPANKVSCPQKSYGQLHYFQVLSTFLYDFCVGHWSADITWCWAKAIDNIHLYFISDHKSKVN